MASAAFPQDQLLPQPAGGLAPGAAAAVLVHLGLLAALSISMDWRSRQPELVSAELWAAVPQIAAPAPPPPPPPAAAPAPSPTPPAPPVAQQPAPQPDPDIALERDRRLKAEKLKAAQAKVEEEQKKAQEKAQERAEAERKKKQAAAEAAARAAEEKAEDERTEKRRQETLRRMMAQAGTTNTAGNTGSAAQSAAPSADYLARLRKMLRDQINFNGTVPGNAAAEVTVITAAGGTIISSKLSKSSGHKEWDAAVIRALEKLGTMPRDSDGRVPPSFTLVFRQND